VADSPESTLTVGTDERGGEPPRVASQLVLGLQCARPTATPARYSLHGLDTVVLGRGDTRSATIGDEGGHRTLTVRIPDRRMSVVHTRLRSGLGRWTIEDAGSKNGTFVNGVTVERGLLDDDDVVEAGHTFFIFRQAAALDADAPTELDGSELERSLPGLATLSSAFAPELVRLRRIAQSNVPVVLRGESGTGKEVVARALHVLSERSGEFVAINCGALPETLVESELFGHRQGAFTGATSDRPGLIRSAHGGTLLLDEIGDLPLASQAALLRVLQEGEVVPVGDTRPIPVDVRIVAASHRDLDALTARGQLRPDLLARISGFQVELPALRDRREDLGLLIGTLLSRHGGDRAAQAVFTPAAARLLFTYDWPMNIRELDKCLEAALVLAGDGPIAPEALPEAIRAHRRRAAPSAREEEQRRRRELVSLLTEHQGNVAAVARAMGKARMQIQRWVKRYGLDPSQFRR